MTEQEIKAKMLEAIEHHTNGIITDVEESAAAVISIALQFGRECFDRARNLTYKETDGLPGYETYEDYINKKP